MEYRPYYLAREWVRMGHAVAVAAASVSHVRTRTPVIRGTVTRETIDGIRYFWLKTPDYQGNGIARAFNIFVFVGRLMQYRKRLSRIVRPNVVIASSTYPLDMVPAYFIARLCRARLLFEVHDLWPLSPIELGSMSKRHPFILLMQGAENWAYRKAEIVVSMLPHTRDHMVQHGMKPEKFVHIPNGVDVEEWGDEPQAMPEEHKRALSALKARRHFLLGYTGAHGLANALDCFIDAAFQLQKHPVTFVLVGQGPEKDRLKRKVQSRQQTNVIFLPPVEKKAMPDLLQAMDALYVGLKDDPLFRFGVSPNKLMDYMMAAKPVIYAIRAGNDAVAESRCGISIPPENPGEIVRAVLNFMSRTAESRRKIGRRGKAFVLANHDYRILAKRFLVSLERAA